jgi:hypothetical protein
MQGWPGRGLGVIPVCIERDQIEEAHVQLLRDLPPAYMAILVKAVVSVIALALTLALNAAMWRLLQRTFHDSSRMHTLRMVLRNTILFAASALVAFIWIGFGNLPSSLGSWGRASPLPRRR